MSHIRTTIRAAMKAVLEDALPSADYDIFASRKFKVNSTLRALIDMRFSSENISNVTMGTVRTHDASLYIRCQRKADEASLDDLLDADEIAINTAIMSQDWNPLLMEQPELVQVNFTEDATTGNAIASIVLRYDLQYRATNDDLETVRD